MLCISFLLIVSTTVFLYFCTTYYQLWLLKKKRTKITTLNPCPTYLTNTNIISTDPPCVTCIVCTLLWQHTRAIRYNHIIQIFHSSRSIRYHTSETINIKVTQATITSVQKKSRLLTTPLKHLSLSFRILWYYLRFIISNNCEKTSQILL